MQETLRTTTWTAPEFEEVNLGSEIGSYYENEDEPSFLKRGSVSRHPYALERRMQRSGAALRGV